MKKILYCLTALFAVMLASCSNDDIEVLQTGDVNFSVNTQSVYDEFNMSNTVKEKFLADNVKLGVYTFVYDEKGDLAVSDSMYTKTFGLVQQNFKLPKGEYTTITIEMMVDEDLNNMSESWIIIGKDKLSTIEIVQRQDEAYWYSAIGYSSNRITVSDDNGQTVDVTPKAIGSIIQVNALRFNNTTDYDLLYFTTKDQPRGRFLSPEYTGDNRFDYEKYNAENTWSVRGYVYAESFDFEEGMSVYFIEDGRVHYGIEPSHTVVLENGNLGYGQWPHSFPSENSYYEFRDGQRYYAGLAYLGGGGVNECSAAVFDNYNSYQTWTSQLPDLPASKADADPYLTWGANAATVKSYMTNKGLIFKNDGVNSEKEIYWSAYKNSNNNHGYEYRFYKDKTNLKSVLESYAVNSYNKTDILNRLKLKYKYVGYNSKLGGELLTSDTVVLLVYDLNDANIGVLYVPNTSSSESSMKYAPAVKALKAAM